MPVSRAELDTMKQEILQAKTVPGSDMTGLVSNFLEDLKNNGTPNQKAHAETINKYIRDEMGGRPAAYRAAATLLQKAIDDPSSGISQVAGKRRRTARKVRRSRTRRSRRSYF